MRIVEGTVGLDPAVRPKRTTTIISAWPRQAFSRRLACGDFDMPANERCEEHRVVPCPVCKQVAMYVVTQRTESSDIGDDRHVVFPIDDLQLAYDLVRGSEQYGVVVCQGPTPTKEEIDQAYAKMERYLKDTLEYDDSVWSAVKIHPNAEHAMIAAQFFNVPRDWATDNAPKDPCPSCRTWNPASAARCSNPACGAVLDWEKARELAVISPEQVRYGLAMGKLTPIPGVDDLEPGKAGKGPRAQ